ncbi:MAG: hypothetical protein Q8K66_06090 [Sediminibacterium sp.]|nr:hypothetical protein [Sediminibacterium sp.]
MKDSTPDSLMQYAGYAVQLAVGLGLAVWAGIWADRKIAVGIPVLSWLLPLVVLIGMLIKVVKDTSKK